MVEHARCKTDSSIGTSFYPTLEGGTLSAGPPDRALTAAIRLPYTANGTADASPIERSMCPVLAMSWAATSGVMTAET